MRLGNNEKRETTHDERNGTTKSRRNKNARKKGNLKILRNIGSRHHQTRGYERKKLKKNIYGERERYSNPN